jgi:hypothetical protein
VEEEEEEEGAATAAVAGAIVAGAAAVVQAGESWDTCWDTWAPSLVCVSKSSLKHPTPQITKLLTPQGTHRL